MSSRKLAVLLCTLLLPLLPAPAVIAANYQLTIAKGTVNITGSPHPAVLINNTMPGPMLHWHEGESVAIEVHNTLDEPTAIHWHGIILPNAMDGVPGMQFEAIPPGGSHTYRFTVRQHGTYWYHSHADLQEQAGMFAPIVIDPVSTSVLPANRDYAVMLSDWTDEAPWQVFSKLKKQGGYYNYNKRTIVDFLHDVRSDGMAATMERWSMWMGMRMDPTDIADVTASTYTYLVNGKPPAQPWSALVHAGDTVRLRLINASAMTYFDVRIPGLTMTVIQADGQDVTPITVDELRIAVAETYDVLIAPTEDRAYTLFAETMDRSGYTYATLTPQPGLETPVPARRKRPLLTMTDMGMHHGSQGHTSVQTNPPQTGTPATHDPHAGHHLPQASSDTAHPVPQQQPMVHHGPDTHGPANDMVAQMPRSRLHEAGPGLDTNARRVLVYTDLQRARPALHSPTITREIEMHLTGSMQRFIWSFDGIKYSEAQPIVLRYGERVKFTLINDTMMNHPIHLHGMWSELENGQGQRRPLKHVINVKPAELVSFYVDADALGEWAFHCHLLYHMEAGMFRKIVVTRSGRMDDHAYH